MATNTTKSTKRGANRPAFELAAARIANLGLEDTIRFVENLVESSPRAATFIRDQLVTSLPVASVK